MADAYLVEVTTPSGETRRELYHTQGAADQTVAMYARAADKWQTRVYPLTRLPEAGDSLVPPKGSTFFCQNAGYICECCGQHKYKHSPTLECMVPQKGTE